MMLHKGTSATRYNYCISLAQPHALKSTKDKLNTTSFYAIMKQYYKVHCRTYELINKHFFKIEFKEFIITLLVEY